MNAYWRNILVQPILIMVAVVFICINAVAGEAGDLQLDIDEQVIYCAVQWQGNGEALVQTLQDGIAVTFIWRVQVEKVQDYWINESIADIQVSRRVLSDLLSRNWVLEDEASGISRRVTSVPEAIRFLTRLEHFPVLDRSLLATNTPYRISISVVEQQGEINDAWWAALWRSVKFNTEQVFSLP